MARKRTRRSTRGWVPCREDNCRDIARMFGVDPDPVLRAFLGEDMKEVMAIVDAALVAEAAAEAEGRDFGPAAYFPRWAVKNRKGRHRPPEKRTPLQVLEFGKEA